MINAEKLLSILELQVDIQELQVIGLTQEEILGYIEFFYDSWSFVEVPALN